MIITIKATDGTTLGTSAEISSIDRLTVNKTTNSNAYVLGENTTTGDSVTVNFTIDPTKTFLGLIISPISSIDYGYPVGSTVEVSYTDDISLWVLYDNTAPDPDPEPEVYIDVTIKNASGTTLASSQGISEISSIGIISSTESSQKTVTLTDVNGEVITLSWYSVEDGKTFRGLGFTPTETTTPTYPTNSGELDANWTTNTTLYEVWTTDPDPDPEPDPEPETIDITIKNSLGVTLASSQGISEISTIGIISSTDSTRKTVTLTDVNGEVITLSWWSIESGRTFRGLGFTPTETTTPTYPTNSGELEVNWTTNTTLYEVWTTDDPPEPEPEPEPEPDPTTFDINLYNNTAEINRLDKSDYLTSAGTLRGTLRDECSLISPIITFYSESVPSFNYVYISQFSRFYYVVGMSSINKNVWRMELSCDVLMTYRTQIYNCGGVVTRSASLIDSGVIDGEVAFDTETQYRKIPLGVIGKNGNPLFAESLTAADMFLTVTTYS